LDLTQQNFSETSGENGVFENRANDIKIAAFSSFCKVWRSATSGGEGAEGSAAADSFIQIVQAGRERQRRQVATILSKIKS